MNQLGRGSGLPQGWPVGPVSVKDCAGTPEPGVGEGPKAHLISQVPYTTP